MCETCLDVDTHVYDVYVKPRNESKSVQLATKKQGVSESDIFPVSE